MNRRRRFFSWGRVITLTICAYLAYDIVDFARVCQNYSSKSASGAMSIPWKVSENEAIVVLAGDVRRIPKAVELVRARQSPLLVISGAGRGVSKLDLVNQQGDAITHVQQTWEKIVIESRSESTVENAREAKRILSPRGIKEIILVTSDYHMPRARNIFELVYPGVRYWLYSIPSRPTVSTFFSKDTFLLAWKVFLEYWKNFAFEHFWRFYLNRT